MSNKVKQFAEQVNAALPIIGKDAYATKPKHKQSATERTLTQLVKEAKEAAIDAENRALITKTNEKEAFNWRMEAARESSRAWSQARTAKWCAAIAAASAIVSIVAAL